MTVWKPFWLRWKNILKDLKKKIKKTDECKDTADSSVCDSNCELDNLYQEVEVIKEEAEAEAEKVKKIF